MAEQGWQGHWLLRIAQQAGLQGLDELDREHRVGTAEVWAEICGCCGLDEWELARLAAAHLQIDLADLSLADYAATRLLPASVANQYCVYPLSVDYHCITVAACDPFNVDMEQTVRFVASRTPVVQLAPPAAIKAAIASHYFPDQAAEDLLQPSADDNSVHVVTASAPEDVDLEQAQSSPVVKLTNQLLREAVDQGASDIHLQPTTTAAVARFRVDGILHQVMELPIAVLNRVISRIKIMANLDITVRRRPQDGRARIMVDGVRFDLRVSTVPTRGTEKAVIRIPATAQMEKLGDLRISLPELEKFRSLISKREGIVVVAGPTGSGKTTTIYSGLRELAVDEVNIITVEDPVEHEVSALTQIQVDPKQGVTFSSALRSVLRQDPDVIFVGEIRDLETAKMAVQAALTGHFVLATLHSNSAVGAVRRLQDLGLDRSSIADTLRGSLAQRLLRKLCVECCASVAGKLDREELRLAKVFQLQPTMRAIGCERCLQSGYRGRIPIVEIFVSDPTIQLMISNGATANELISAATAGGMRSLMEVALERVAAGDTTLAEVERIIGASTMAAATNDESVQVVKPAARSKTLVQLLADATRSKAQACVHILVVDDDGADRTIARALLEREGFVVSEAADGEQALALLRQKSDYTLMILDLEMPNIGGREVLASVRCSEDLADLPIIVLTGASDAEVEVALLRAGADDYIRKPLAPSPFLARVAAALRRAQG